MWLGIVSCIFELHRGRRVRTGIAEEEFETNTKAVEHPHLCDLCQNSLSAVGGWERLEKNKLRCLHVEEELCPFSRIST